MPFCAVMRASKNSSKSPHVPFRYFIAGVFSDSGSSERCGEVYF
ncbi:hypothetical protein RRSWK_02223 [Rhodopirellula sp. SWK7]|nr:hypothetical protein RRSWK_02223 [Rhodopirellula sp. SWK7]